MRSERVHILRQTHNTKFERETQITTQKNKFHHEYGNLSSWNGGFWDKTQLKKPKAHFRNGSSSSSFFFFYLKVRFHRTIIPHLSVAHLKARFHEPLNSFLESRKSPKHHTHTLSSSLLLQLLLLDPLPSFQSSFAHFQTLFLKPKSTQRCSLKASFKWVKQVHFVL